MSEFSPETLALYHAVVKDLCDETLGGYTPASDNDDEEYNELYCPSDPEQPALYILRPDATTLLLSALDNELRDIEIKTPEDWATHRARLTPALGLPFERV